MTKRCIYCSREISGELPIDVCKRCGIGVWGEKMFNAICQGMDTEKQKGNMELGRVSDKELEARRKLEGDAASFVETKIISAQHQSAKTTKQLNLSSRPIVNHNEDMKIIQKWSSLGEDSISKNDMDSSEISEFEVRTF